MAKKRWIKMDNASNIFMASLNATDTKVFRLSAELYEDVDFDVLNRAVETAYDHFPLYQYVIRRGVFWYYLEENKLRPEVTIDNKPPCSAIYNFDRKELLFRVVYYGKRIHLEVFHALSDGTGAVWFMENILFYYLKELYPEEFKDIPSPDEKGSINQILYDSFERHFSEEKSMTIPDTDIESAISKNFQSIDKTYRVKGTRTEDRRMRVVEASMPVADVLKISRSYGVSLTVFLTALYMYAVYEDAPKTKPITISATVPINLRQFFKSHSARNFFSTMIVNYKFYPENIDIADLMSEIKRQFEENMEVERLRERQKKLVGYENNIIVKILPRPLKNHVLKMINKRSNKKLTISTSNLGIVKYKEEIEKYVDKMYIEVSAVRPQFVSLTFKEYLTIGFTTPFIETEIQKNFIRFLTERGVKVEVAANRVGRKHLEKEKEQEDERV